VKSQIILVPQNELGFNTMRDVLAVPFRHRRIGIATGIGAVILAVLFSLFLPRYKAEMELLVEHDRVDPTVNPVGDKESSQQYGVRPVTEEELNSEVELLTSKDVEEEVVKRCGLYLGESSFVYPPAPKGVDPRIAKAAKKLDSNLDITVIKRSNIIDVTYKNSDAQMANKVLQNLLTLYLEKHSAVHRPSGQADFFDAQAAKYKASLAAAEQNLIQFSRTTGTTAAAAEKEMAIKNANTFDSDLKQVQAQISATEEAIKLLQSKGAANLSRITTSRKTADNPQLQEKLKATLLDLELKRTQLLDQFQPEYREVKEVEKEITETKTAIAESEKAPVREETTDLDPTHEWMRSELAKSQTELQSLQARAAESKQIVSTYRQEAQRLNEQGIEEASLLRDAKTEEDNYVLYVKKGGEARITDALDRSKIVNVTVASPAMVPSLPNHPFWLYGLVGIAAAFLMGGTSIVAAEYLDPTFRSPMELAAVLHVPVLAAVPFQLPETTGDHNNGNGRHSRVEESQLE
jgi:uncharacterized protein involved in exopolysaccharide biosynthesis